tara:strand:- start:445 stop:723 length:279 start_codon:yes stop_codon:yes gene_type:complete
MPTINIPSLLLNLTDGVAEVELEAKNIRQVINQLEKKFPGIEDRLCDDEGRVRPNIGVCIDGVMVRRSPLTEVSPTSQMHFLPAVSSGIRNS